MTQLLEIYALFGGVRGRSVSLSLLSHEIDYSSIEVINEHSRAASSNDWLDASP
jgi:hypothetical protein